MMSDITSKPFGPIKASCSADEKLQTALAEDPTPVDYLLAGLVGCYALSVAEVANMKNLAMAAHVEVTLSGHYADNLPVRIGHVVVQVKSGFLKDSRFEAEVVKAAVEEWIVGNSLEASMEVQLLAP